MRGASSPPSLKALAIGYLSRREYSRVELRTRLLATFSKQVSARAARVRSGTDVEAKSRFRGTVESHAGLDGDVDVESRADASVNRSIEVDSLLDWLEAQGYLSDVRFVESRLRVRAERQGLWRIRQELTQHGVELDPAQVAGQRATEFARAQAVWERKFGTLATDARGRAAQARFLSSRGFAADVVRRVVGGAMDE